MSTHQIYPIRLTAKQEKFAQAIVDGHSQSEAYKLAYDTTNMLRATIHNSAYKLMHHGEIAARIAELRAPVASALVAKRIHTAESLAEEAMTNLKLARASDQLSAANKSIELVAKLTGVFEAPTRTEPPIQQIVIVQPAPNVPPSEKKLNDGESGVSRGVV